MTDRPLGPIVENWTPPARPEPPTLAGRYARIEPLTLDHAAGLWEVYKGHDWIWDYIPEGPFPDADACADWVGRCAASADPRFVALCWPDGRVFGVASFLRISPKDGSIEVGYITISPSGQGTTAATEALFLMMQWAFGAGYRRYEWKCNALNMPSRRAAQRFGFSYEGIFRKATIVKGRNRDTAWFAVTDDEWPVVQAAHHAWLDPENFDADGQQKQSLRDLTRPALVMLDPEV